ncbi:MAG: hypothetical protein LUC92_10315 [Clostridiales bacterium]|nr:hypothetical protein [Clostridiales bacterium]
MADFGPVEYMIAALCALAFCIVFSGILKKLVFFGLRGAFGLLAVKLLNSALAGAGVFVGVNIINGVLIGVLGFPALIGLYAVRFFGV